MSRPKLQPHPAGGDLADAIPPAYTEWIGARLLEHIAAERAA